MGINIEKLLRGYINLLGIYLIIDGAIHLFNIRLQSVVNVWPQSALSYATLLNVIYASFVFLAATLVFVAQKDLKKYKTLIMISAIWAFIHGLLLIFLSLTQNFSANFLILSSLSVWIPFYDQYLLLESFLAFVYVVLVFIWIKNNH